VSYVLGTITFQLTQTADGKPKVLILADDPYTITVELGQIKTPPVYSHSPVPDIPIIEQPAIQPATGESAKTEPPVCGIHHTPMTLVLKSKNGPFWSCHKRMIDSGWCNYRS